MLNLHITISMWTLEEKMTSAQNCQVSFIHTWINTSPSQILNCGYDSDLVIPDGKQTSNNNLRPDLRSITSTNSSSSHPTQRFPDSEDSQESSAGPVRNNIQWSMPSVTPGYHQTGRGSTRSPGLHSMSGGQQSDSSQSSALGQSPHDSLCTQNSTPSEGLRSSINPDLLHDVCSMLQLLPPNIRPSDDLLRMAESIFQVSPISINYSSHLQQVRSQHLSSSSFPMSRDGSLGWCLTSWPSNTQLLARF
jgi:hypothetical protein